MRQLTARVGTTLTRSRVLDQLVALGAGVVASMALAVTLVAFGTSSQEQLEKAWTPPGSVTR